jgi:isopentenyl phosphate kinase
MTIFLKLGGSLITDKSTPETIRPEVIKRLSEEVARAIKAAPDTSLLIGHGSGSFGHVAASKYGTRNGIRTGEGWRGFAKVSAAATRLNSIVLEALNNADVPVFHVQPSATAVCRDGWIAWMGLEPLQTALDHHLVPLIYGDVAIDSIRGGTIISTEEIFSWLADTIKPSRILLAGDREGVQDENGEIIPRITTETADSYRAMLGRSAATDVTGGMASKVKSMLGLCERHPDLDVVIFSGLIEGNVENALLGKPIVGGTRLAK